MATITAANIVFTMWVPAVFPAPITLSGFATDDAFATERVEPAEVQLGVDGILSAAYIPFVSKTIIALQADSPSLLTFDTWLAAETSAQEIYVASGIILYPSIGKSFALTGGYLTGLVQFPAAKKKLQPSSFEITWQSIVPSLIPIG
jgi:hypothetical protein